MSFELKGSDGSLLRVDRDWMRLGRADDNDLVVRHPAISRYHLNFYLKNGQFIVEDAGSQNGFLYNGKPAKGAVAISHGDRLVVGEVEYTVQVPGVAPAAQPSTLYSSSTSAPLPGGNNQRIRIYALAAAALFIFVFASKDDKPKAPEKKKSSHESSLSSEGYRPSSYHTRSISEIQSEAKFHEAMRDYDNGNYSRALIGFTESRTLNPENDNAAAYISLSEERMKSQMDKLLEDAKQSEGSLQYHRAKGQAAQVLTILSEQIPGYGRKVAQEAAIANEQKRPPGQEETLLNLPCASTRYPEICTQSVEVIRRARQNLGEEDALK